MSEIGWGSKEFAEAWKKRAEERLRTMGAMTDRMLAEAGVVPGARVLDLGTGTGDTALLAAARVGPGGSVLATDASPSMVEVARDAVKSAGASNVEVRRMDASALDVEAGSFDAAIARQVLMFVDRARTLTGIVRALREGGRFAATVWGSLLENPYHRVTIEAARARGGWSEPPPEVVRAFSVVEPEVEWPRRFQEAGLRNVAVHVVVGERRFPSVEAAVAAMRESPIHREPVERLPAAVREEAWEEIAAECRGWAEGEGGTGECVMGTQHLVVSGRK
jgi:ubiquinone/menaquinone biosynthesis C-methylase UbiE